MKYFRLSLACFHLEIRRVLVKIKCLEISSLFLLNGNILGLTLCFKKLIWKVFFFLSAVLILVSLLEVTDLEIGKVFVKIKCIKKIISLQ